MTAPATPSAGRLRALDRLRALAVTAVFLEHAGPRLFGGVRDFHARYFQIGQFGVSLFFLCSGFVIPYSLEAKPSVRRFWVNRFFRLFPLYWASLAAALVLAWLHFFELSAGFRRHWLPSVLANLTMLQGFLGWEHAISPYWSLGYELVFYGLVTLLFLRGWHGHTGRWVAFLLGLSVLNPAVSRYAWGHPAHIGIVFHFATLFFGTLVFRHYQGGLSTRRLTWAAFGALLAAFLANWLGLHGLSDETGEGTREFLPMTAAWFAAYGIFLAVYAGAVDRRRGIGSRDTPREARWGGALIGLGTISYSVYLTHALVIGGIPAGGGPWLTLLEWSGLTILISIFAYRWIEKPGMRAGKRWAEPGHRPRAPGVPS